MEELWGRMCLSFRYQERVTEGFASLEAATHLKWVPGWLFPWQILIAVHLAIHLTPKRKWFTSLERYKVFHYLIIYANSYSLHPLVSLIMARLHQLSACALLSEAVRPSLGSWIGFLSRRTEEGRSQHFLRVAWVQGRTCVTLCNLCERPCEECIVTSAVLRRRPVAVGSQSQQVTEPKRGWSCHLWAGAPSEREGPGCWHFCAPWVCRV